MLLLNISKNLSLRKFYLSNETFTGIGAYVFLPQVMVNAVYDASTFFSTHKGKLKADIQNLNVTMEVHISRNESERLNIIEVRCSLCIKL